MVLCSELGTNPYRNRLIAAAVGLIAWILSIVATEGLFQQVIVSSKSNMDAGRTFAVFGTFITIPTLIINGY